MMRGPRRDRRQTDRGAVLGRTALAMLAALAALALAPALSGAEVPIPTFPPVPPIHIHLPKPEEKAIFNVIVEGRAKASIHVDITGPTVGCVTTIQGDATDTATYLRGKGVHLEVDRYGKEVVIHRSGRETDTSMTLVIADTRTAEGKGYAESANIPNVPCTLATESVSQEECGEPQDSKATASLEYDLGIMNLKINEKGLYRAINQCGDTEHFGDALTQFAMAFPSSPKLLGDRLSLGQIFGRKPVLKLHFASGFAGVEHEATRPALAPFTGITKEKATNEATVRLVRIK